MIEKTLSTGRKVKIKQLSIDEMDDCKDIQKISLKDGATLLLDTNKARTKWIRTGLIGGEFKNFEMNGSNCPTDRVLRQLTNAEMDELLVVIQEAQTLGEEIPSNTS